MFDQSYAGSSWGVLHKSDQIESLLGHFLGDRTAPWSMPFHKGLNGQVMVTINAEEGHFQIGTFSLGIYKELVWRSAAK